MSYNLLFFCSRLACYSLFLNREPGNAPEKKPIFLLSHSRYRLANPTSSLFHLYTALRRKRTKKLV